MCCNGVIFADVQLQRGDVADKLASIGIAFRKKGKTQCFNQPCVALEGCRCRVYADRPQYCRDFECALLKSVLAGSTSPDAAGKTIRKAAKRAEKVRKLLRVLGNVDEAMPLSKRFQRVKKQMDMGSFDHQSAGVFGDLSMAMHELNVLLSDEFYPGT